VLLRFRGGVGLATSPIRCTEEHNIKPIPRSHSHKSRFSLHSSYFIKMHRYPDRLEDAAKTLYDDPFRLNSLPVYRALGMGRACIFYCVGPNGADDGGLGDDLVWAGGCDGLPLSPEFFKYKMEKLLGGAGKTGDPAGGAKFKGLVIGSPEDAPFLLGDWNESEKAMPPAGPSPEFEFPSYRWTGGESGIRWLVDPRRSYTLVVSGAVPPWLQGGASASAGGDDPEILLNGRPLMKMTGTGWQLKKIPIPPELFAGRDTAYITFKTATRTSAERNSSSTVPRNLGIMVNYVNLIAGE